MHYASHYAMHYSSHYAMHYASQCLGRHDMPLPIFMYAVLLRFFEKMDALDVTIELQFKYARV